MILLSIIIPVYNAEKFIERAIRSVINRQWKLDNYEVLCINDGSSDRSCEIIQKLKSDNAKIRLIDINNQGVSHARNVGIENAKGKYVLFLDADDFFVDDCLQDLLDKMIINNFDVINFGYIRTDCMFLKGQVAEYDICSVSNFEYYQINVNPNPFCWSYLYKRSTIGEIRFNESLIICEDFVFVEQILYSSRKIGVFTKNIYGYFNNLNSVMKKAIDDKLKLAFVHSYFESISLVYNLYNIDHISPELRPWMLFRLEHRSFWFFKRSKDKEVIVDIVWYYRNRLPFGKFKYFGRLHKKNYLNLIRKLVFNHRILFKLAFNINLRNII